MKKVVPILYFLLFIFIYFESCSSTEKAKGISENDKTLKEVYRNAFLMGVSFNDAIISGGR